MQTFPRHAALLIIDVQDGFDAPRWGRRNNPAMESRIVELLAAWRASGRPVIHAKHMSPDPTSPLRPGQPGNAFKAVVAPRDGEIVVEKRVHSCFIGTPLEAELRRRGHDTLVIVGMMTINAVSASVEHRVIHGRARFRLASERFNEVHQIAGRQRERDPAHPDVAHRQHRAVVVGKPVHAPARVDLQRIASIRRLGRMRRLHRGACGCELHDQLIDIANAERARVAVDREPDHWNSGFAGDFHLHRVIHDRAFHFRFHSRGTAASGGAGVRGDERIGHTIVK